MVLDPILQSLPVHFFGSLPQPPTSPTDTEFANSMYICICLHVQIPYQLERWGAGVETQKNVRGEIRAWGRVPFNEPYAPSLSTIYDGA